MEDILAMSVVDNNFDSLFFDTERTAAGKRCATLPQLLKASFSQNSRHHPYSLGGSAGHSRLLLQLTRPGILSRSSLVPLLLTAAQV